MWKRALLGLDRSLVAPPRSVIEVDDFDLQLEHITHAMAAFGPAGVVEINATRWLDDAGGALSGLGRPMRIFE